MILPLAIITQLATSCAPPVTWNLLRGIAARESGFNPNAIHVNGHPGRSYYPATTEAAIDKARQQMQWTPRGAHLLLQIRTRTLDGTFRPLFERWYPGLANDNDIARQAEAA